MLLIFLGIHSTLMKSASEKEFPLLHVNLAQRPVYLSFTRQLPSSIPLPATTTTKPTTSTITTTQTLRMTFSSQTNVQGNQKAANWPLGLHVAVVAPATGTSAPTRRPLSLAAHLWPRRGRPSTRPRSSCIRGSPTLPSNVRPDPSTEL